MGRKLSIALGGKWVIISSLEHVVDVVDGKTGIHIHP
jgi:carbamate kinase